MNHTDNFTEVKVTVEIENTDVYGTIYSRDVYFNDYVYTETLQAYKGLIKSISNSVRVKMVTVVLFNHNQVEKEVRWIDCGAQTSKQAVCEYQRFDFDNCEPNEMTYKEFIRKYGKTYNDSAFYTYIENKQKADV